LFFQLPADTNSPSVRQLTELSNLQDSFICRNVVYLNKQTLFLFLLFLDTSSPSPLLSSPPNIFQVTTHRFVSHRLHNPPSLSQRTANCTLKVCESCYPLSFIMAPMFGTSISQLSRLHLRLALSTESLRTHNHFLLAFFCSYSFVLGHILSGHIQLTQPPSFALQPKR
jgi:hypothetical protein